jgi:hypothetical protein
MINLGNLCGNLFYVITSYCAYLGVFTRNFIFFKSCKTLRVISPYYKNKKFKKRFLSLKVKKLKAFATITH